MNQMLGRNVDALKVTLVESMCMGYLPATLTHNPGMAKFCTLKQLIQIHCGLGIQHLLKFLLGTIPRGIGRTMIMEEVHKQYYNHLLRYQTEISGHVVSQANGVAVMPGLCSQILHVQQDLWSSGCLDSYLGMTISKVDNSGNFKSSPLACVPLTCYFC